MVPALLGLGAIAALLWRGTAQLPPGQRPFDSFPPGVNAEAPITREDFKGSSGNRYEVTGFAVADGRMYYVATKRGDVDWISYVVTPQGGRQRWHINADKREEIAEMMLDFSLSEAVT